MTTAAFNAEITANGGEKNLLSIRIRGGEMIYIATSHDREIDIENDANRTKFIIAGDVVKVYKPIQSPQGPQIRAVSVIEISSITGMSFFFDKEIHTDFTEKEAFGSGDDTDYSAG